MKLDQLVETTFLPPPVVTKHNASNEVFEFSCKQTHGEYLPIFSGNGGYEDGYKRDYFIESSFRARANSRSKRYFENKVQAMKLCWSYFREKKGDFVPKVNEERR